MKEQTYGWYPSAKNVYEDRRIDTLTPYQLEALYRYRDSKYYQPPATPPEQRTPKPPRASPSSAGRPKSTSSNAGHTTQNLHLRVTSAPIHTTYKPPPKLNLPTPQQCWSTHVPETEITIAPQQYSPAPPVPQSPAPCRTSPPLLPMSTTPTAVRATPVRESPVSTQKQSGKIVRIQSATVRRETPSKPQRPAKSAGPVRPSPSPLVPHESPVQAPPAFCQWPYPCGDVNYDVTEVQYPDMPPHGTYSPPRPSAPSPVASFKRGPSRTSIPSPSGKPPSGRKTPLRPKAPSPYKMDYHQLELDDRAQTPDYLEETKKHGWMMEVHGDPLKLKKVSRRLPYTVKVDEPETERDPPKVHMENLETFFLNTIPRRPMAFTIDKEWISEVIHKKRMEMQKKHGLNHRYKNFSFVY